MPASILVTIPEPLTIALGLLGAGLLLLCRCEFGKRPFGTPEIQTVEERALLSRVLD
jgi:hypothetical protein